MSPQTSQTTVRFKLVVLWIICSAFHYGYGISQLNPLQPILTCHSRGPNGILTSLSPVTSKCIPLTDQQFGLVTSLFTLGGLVSSFLVPFISKSLAWGRKKSIIWSSVFTITGSLFLASASSMVGLSLGRFLQGIGSGIGVVVVPIFLNEISPTSIQGSVGVLNQLAIVFGIFTAQALGGSSLGSSDTMWRIVPLCLTMVSALQFVFSFIIAVESPGWLEGEGKTAESSQQAHEVRRLLWTAKELESYRDNLPSSSSEETQGLLDAVDNQHIPSLSAPVAGLGEIFTDPQIWPGTKLVMLTQIGQQLSGVNAVLYYSTGILSTILPSLAGSIGILITVINIIMTFPPIFLIQESRLGRKKLILLSASTMAISSFLLGLGIVYQFHLVSVIAIVLVVASFSFGLGPVPFVILPELVPSRAVSLVTSLGLTLNWTINFLVGLIFLPLKNRFAQWDPNHTGGYVFWLFAGFNLGFVFLFSRWYRSPSSSFST